jgi:hypothetical protein
MSTAIAVFAASSIAIGPLIVAVIVGLLLAILCYVVFNHIAPSYAGLVALGVFLLCLLVGVWVAVD